MKDLIDTVVVSGEANGRYGFGDGHPFGADRQESFLRVLHASGLESQVRMLPPRLATRAELESFHSAAYLDFVAERSQSGGGYLDQGDTPAFTGVYEAASAVVGAALVGVEAIMSGSARRAFVPIAGLHHAARDRAAGFCVFNDCGVVIEQLRQRFGVRRIAYIDIDAHHGDGVFYAFEEDPDLRFADLHQDGRTLYPGTGAAGETGRGLAVGSKLNIPLAPGSDDRVFNRAWQQIEDYVQAEPPEFLLLQCGADSLQGDPLTQLGFSEEAHALAARRLAVLADRHCHGRVLALGGGGYNRENIGRAWLRVVKSFVEHPLAVEKTSLGVGLGA